MMERNEMIEMIMSKINATREEAIEALQKSNWDVVDAILYLERKGKNENKEVTIIEVKTKDEKSSKDENFGGIGEIFGRVVKFAGRVLKKANSSYFEIRKEDKKPIRMTLTMLVFALIFLSVPTVILLVLGLFGGYKYSVSGFNTNEEGVNNIFEEVSKSANNIKRDFKEGYTK